MTKDSLRMGQRLTVRVIETLGFGRIERLRIRDGEPCFESAPRIVQELKLGSTAREKKPKCVSNDLTLKEEFVDLFAKLGRLPDGFVAVEVRHSLPFRIILNRELQEFES